MIGAVLLGLLVVLILGPPAFFIGPALIPIALLIGIGVLLWRAAGGAPPAATRAGSSPARRSRCVIGIAAVGGFAGVFLLAALGGGTTLAVLAILAGVALVVAGLSGGARWLIAPALVLVLPLAIVAAADVKVDGGIGERQLPPGHRRELRSDYELGMGELIIDMRDVDLPAGTTRMRVELGIGHAVVRVPEDACVSSDVQIGAGHAQVLDRSSDGLDVDFAQAAVAHRRLAAAGARRAGRHRRARGRARRRPAALRRDGWWDDNADLSGPACP